jgi:hypothetical protein
LYHIKNLKCARRGKVFVTVIDSRYKGLITEVAQMPAFNVVRFKVKEGRENEFLRAHQEARPGFSGFTQGHMVKTGDRQYCFIGEWKSFDDIAGAREKMISMLNTFRDCLEDLGGGLGVTDPVSGTSVLEIKN